MTETAFDDIADALAARGARRGSMFGKAALLSGTKAFACLHGEMFAVKLGAGTPAHAEALGFAGAELFDPSGRHRPFKDWVALPAAHVAEWARFAEAALPADPPPCGARAAAG
jgi:hypothetical protein